MESTFHNALTQFDEFDQYELLLLTNGTIGNATAPHHVGVPNLVLYSWFASQLFILSLSYFGYWADVLYNVGG